MGCLQTLHLMTHILRSGASMNYVATGHSGSIPMDTQRALAVRQMQCGLKLDHPPGYQRPCRLSKHCLESPGPQDLGEEARTWQDRVLVPGPHTPGMCPHIPHRSFPRMGRRSHHTRWREHRTCTWPGRKERRKT